jgi:prolyl-tRNA synthetase
VFMARRDNPPSLKQSMDRDEFINTITQILDSIQQTLFDRALAFQKANTLTIDDNQKFYDLYKNTGGAHNGAFVFSHWCGSRECEEQIKKDLSVTIRCIPFDSPKENGHCICCKKPSEQRVLFAKAY